MDGNANDILGLMAVGGARKGWLAWEVPAMRRGREDLGRKSPFPVVSRAES